MIKRGAVLSLFCILISGFVAFKSGALKNYVSLDDRIAINLEQGIYTHALDTPPKTDTLKKSPKMLYSSKSTMVLTQEIVFPDSLFPDSARKAQLMLGGPDSLRRKLSGQPPEKK